MVNPFRNILKLFAGDILAKILNFMAFIYLARVLGVSGYGIFEFGIAVITYFLLLVNGGIELWATREAAQSGDTSYLVRRIVPLRFLLASAAFCVMLVLLSLFPSFPDLETVMILFGLSLFANAINLKWVFLGREQLGKVAAGLLVSQAVFAGLVLILVNEPAQVIWVPLLWLAGDLAMAVFFGILYSIEFKRIEYRFTLSGTRIMLRPAFTMATSQGLGLMSYNFDTVLLGFMLGPIPVGLYRAAYKPITMALAAPITYFVGLFPALARSFTAERQVFDGIVENSLKIAATYAFPLGVGGTFLAAPIILTLFGPEYSRAIPAMKILSWSAVLIILRGTFRQSLNAAGLQSLDLRAAAISVGVNVLLNLLLIPRLGIIGAALTTVVSEFLWLIIIYIYYYRNVSSVNPYQHVIAPIVAALAMALTFILFNQIYWFVLALLSLFVYFAVVLMLNRPLLHSLVYATKARSNKLVD